MSNEASSPRSGGGDDEIRAGRPWWTFIIPYAGRVPRLRERQWGLLGLLALAEFFEQYDVSLMGLALKQIQAGLEIPEQQIGGVTAVVRLGSLVAFALSVLADRIGRRRLLLVTILGFTVCTFGTAFAQDARQFMALQFAARVFITAETLLAVVVLAEELHARDRGWGIGMLGALGSIGHGASAAVFAAVDVVPYGWRSLYLVGVVPLLFLAWFRRRLPETRRFEQQRAERDGEGLLGGLRPILHLARMYPRRVAVLATALFPFEFVIATAYTFMPKTLQEVHGYSPGQVTAVFLVGGTLGILGNVVAGQLADRFGRKPVMCAAMAVNGLSLLGFYNATGVAIPLLWVAAVFSILAIGILFKALGTELFPTSHRSTASGMRMVVGALGSVAGLSLEGILYGVTGSHAGAITFMLPLLLLPPLVIALGLPETAGRELEEVSPERPGRS